MCVSRLGISVNEFYDMTPLEVSYALRDLSDREKMKMDGLVRITYESARYIAMNIWNSQGRYLKQEIKQPTELVRFPWDGIGASKKQSVEEMKAIMMSIASTVNKNYERSQKQKKKNVQPG